MEAAQTGSNGSFVPDRLINLGGHYSKCLREWRKKFIANFDDHIAPAMVSRNKEMSPFALEQFKRKFIVCGYLVRIFTSADDVMDSFILPCVKRDSRPRRWVTP